MNMVRIFNFLYGYYVVTMQGRKYEKVLNLMHVNGVYVWDIKYHQDGTIVMKIMRKHIDQFEKLCTRFGVAYKIKSEKGMPVFINRLFRRKGFVIGAFIFISGLFVLSNMVLRIEYPTEYSMRKEELTVQLKEAGFSVGMFKKAVDYEQVKKNFLVSNPNYTYMNITTNGITAKIDLYDKTNPQDIYDYNEPADIVAKCDGTIRQITVAVGTPVVEAGQQVTAGQMLIEGRELIKIAGRESDIYRRAEGKVMASIVCEIDNIPIFMYEPNETCTLEEEKTLKISSFSYKLKKISKIEEKFEYRINEKPFKILDFVLPISIETRQLYDRADAVEKSESKIAGDVIEYIRQNDFINPNAVIEDIMIEQTGQYEDTGIYSVVLTVIDNIGEVVVK